MSYLKRAIMSMALTVWAWNASAIDYTMSPLPTWPSGGTNAGTNAANCTMRVTGTQPLSQSKVLIADDSISTNAIIYNLGVIMTVNSWCAENTTSIYPSVYGLNPPIRIPNHLIFKGFTAAYGYYLTNNSGVALKLYFTPVTMLQSTTGSSQFPNTSYINASNLAPTNVNIGQDIPMVYSGSTYTIAGNFAPFYTKISNTEHRYRFGTAYNNTVFTVRGELIKIGDVQTSSSLSLLPTASLEYAFLQNQTTTNSGTIDITSMFGTGGITFVKPSCRLRGATDYQANLGQWVNVVGGSNTGSLPARGSQKLVDVNIECNGTVNNVYFNFQDAGTSTSSNYDVRLYAGDGQVIEGLEVEMLYNGSRINVRTPSQDVVSGKTNTGTHGTVSSTPTNPGNYNSQSQAPIRRPLRSAQRDHQRR